MSYEYLCTHNLKTNICFTFRYGTRNYAHYSKIGIPGPKPTIFFGNVPAIIKVVRLIKYKCINQSSHLLFEVFRFIPNLVYIYLQYIEPDLGLGKLGNCPESYTTSGPPYMSCHLLFFGILV